MGEAGGDCRDVGQTKDENTSLDDVKAVIECEKMRSLAVRLNLSPDVH